MDGISSLVRLETLADRPRGLRGPAAVSLVGQTAPQGKPPAQQPQAARTVVALKAGDDPAEKTAEAIQKFVIQKLEQHRLQIQRDDDAGRYVYKAIDQDSGEVVRQFPVEEILRLISFFRSHEGLVIDDKA